MGSSLSQQENLFLHQRWEDLLQVAMAADEEALAHSAARGGDAVSHFKRNVAVTSDEFRLSFQEWQAFLSVLEQGEAKEANAAPSDICAHLSATQLNVPVVALMVHLCVWWKGAIPSAVFAERVEQLVRRVTCSGKDSLRGDAVACGNSVEVEATPDESREAHLDPVVGGSCARLAHFVKKRITERASRSFSAISSPAASAEKATEELSLDLLVDMLVLVQQILHQEDTSHSPVSSVSADGNSAMSAAHIYDLYDEKIGDTKELRRRPVLSVVMVLVLAIYAERLQSQPQLAWRGVGHLEALTDVIAAHSGPSGTTASSVTSAAHQPLASSSARSDPWPLAKALEKALVHRQHEADAKRCFSQEGAELRATLLDMRKRRLAIASEGVASVAVSTPSQRWAAAASQYVGQRPIWAALHSHFLSAGVFDDDKPTVLVFFGPSGYGKSELAKRVAGVLHGVSVSELEASGKMVFIHMPSFCTKDSIYSLVDPPAAHVGSGMLLSALQRNPDAVVVLDEFEKSTAEAINNLWLSAFQKNGVLRSLKEASRSVSTVRTTFILTCNIAAESIVARESLYLGATPADQERIRELFITQCKNVCRELMGEPFVNRVDHFFPFMPYTRAERRQFVCLLLERLLANQADKGRILYITPAFVEAMEEKLRTFHAATLEAVVRTQVVRMVRERWTSGVLTVERHVGCRSVVVLLPAVEAQWRRCKTLRRSSIATSSEVEKGEKVYDEEDALFTSDDSLSLEAWDSLPYGAQSLAQWAVVHAVPAVGLPAEDEAGDDDATKHTTTEVSCRKPLIKSVADQPSAQSISSSAAQPQAVPLRCTPSRDTPHREKEYQLEYTIDKKRIVDLEVELEKARELIAVRDLEIVKLKDKVMMLQKALALLLLSLLSCLLLLSLFIGLKLAFLFALGVFGFLVIVLGVPLSVVLDAVRGLFHFLGPFKVGGLVACLLVWVARVSSKTVLSCA